MMHGYCVVVQLFKLLIVSKDAKEHIEHLIKHMHFDVSGMELQSLA